MFETVQSLTGHPLLDRAMVYAAIYLVAAIPASLVALWLRGDKRASFVIFAVTVAGIAVAAGLGQVYSHPPPHLQGYETILRNEPENAFPSDHSAAIFAFAFGTVYAGYRRLAAVAVIAAVLTGFARIYTGLHFPIDVAGGVLAGLVGVAAVAVLSGQVDRAFELALRIESAILDTAKSGIARLNG